MTTGTRKRVQTRQQRFGYGHPFWDEAVELAQQDLPYEVILGAAHRAGYTDITLRNLRIGFYRAPAMLNLPIRYAPALRRRYEEITSTFDALVTMKQLVEQAVTYIDEIDGEMQEVTYDGEGLDRDRLSRLEDERKSWWGAAFRAAKDCAEIDIRLRNPNPVGLPLIGAVSGDGVREERARLLAEIRDAMPIPSLESVTMRFGQDNIRPAVPIETTAQLIEEDDFGDGLEDLHSDIAEPVTEDEDGVEETS